MALSLDKKYKLQRKEYTFEEALNIAEGNENKIIESKVTGYKYKFKDKTLGFIAKCGDWVEISGFEYKEIKGKWYVND